jgi:hypothetical protein
MAKTLLEQRQLLVFVDAQATLVMPTRTCPRQDDSANQFPHRTIVRPQGPDMAADQNLTAGDWPSRARLLSRAGELLESPLYRC